MGHPEELEHLPTRGIKRSAHRAMILLGSQRCGGTAAAARILQWRLFRKDSLGKQGRGVALNVSEQLQCAELCQGTDEELTELVG